MSQTIERPRLHPADERATAEDQFAWATGAAIAGVFSLLAWAAIAAIVASLFG